MNFLNSKYSRRSVLQGMGMGALLLGPLLHNVRAFGQQPKKMRIVFVWVDHGTGGFNFVEPGSTEKNFNLKYHYSPFNALKDKCIFIDGLRAGSDAPHQPFDMFTSNFPLGYNAQANNAKPLGASIDFLLQQKLQYASALRLNSNGWDQFCFDTSGNLLPLASPADTLAGFNTRVGQMSAGASTKPSAATVRQKNALDAAVSELNLFKGRLSGAESEKIEYQLREMRAAMDDVGLGSGMGQAGAGCSVDNSSYGKDPGSLFVKSLNTTRLAFACDYQRIALLSVGGEEHDFEYKSKDGTIKKASYDGARWNTAGASGFSDYHHQIAHSQEVADPVEAQNIYWGMSNYYAQKISDFAQSLAATPDTDGGNVLDNTIIVYCGSQEDGNHGILRLPFVVVAGKNAGFKTGRYLNIPTYEADTLPNILTGGKLPLYGVRQVSTKNVPDLYVPLIQAMGVSNVNSFGYAPFNTGKLDL